MKPGAMLSKLQGQSQTLFDLAQPYQYIGSDSRANTLRREALCVRMKLVKARQIKQGMMQELLTGRIRLI